MRSLGLNSAVSWFMFTSFTTSVRGGWYEATAQHVERLPIASGIGGNDSLADLAHTAQSAAAERLVLQTDVTRRIPDLCPPERREPDGSVKLGRKLEAWWELDFPAFRAEIVKRFKRDLPLAERSEWEDWLATSRREIDVQTAAIRSAEREIDVIVYGLFDLTEDEITLLEANT